MEIINPTHIMAANNNTSTLSALLTFTFLLQMFKGANFFLNSFKSAPNPESDPLTKIKNNLIEAFKKYREMDEEIDERAFSSGHHKSCLFGVRREKRIPNW